MEDQRHTENLSCHERNEHILITNVRVWYGTLDWKVARCQRRRRTRISIQFECVTSWKFVTGINFVVCRPISMFVIPEMNVSSNIKLFWASMSKPTEFGFGKEVWKTVLLVIEIKHLSPFFWLAAILSMAKPQFFLGWFQLSHKFHGWQPAWQNYDRLSRLSRRLRGLVSRLHSLPV